MSPIHLYASSQATPQLLNVGLDVATLNRAVVLRPLSEMPEPEPHYFPALRLERDEVREAIHYAELTLKNFRTGVWTPDAGMENGAKADLDMLQTRLRAINVIIGDERGGDRGGDDRGGPSHG